MRVALVCLALAVLLAGCAGRGGTSPAGERETAASAASDGRYALSGDAYPQDPPDVSEIPDAVPRVEPRSRGGNRETYQVWGKTYRVLPEARGYARQGTASWYGEKFHGYATSNGEIYDMYKMSAAHRSLPLPTYARVTSLDSGRSVIVRVNDRGPFHSDREIDLSYAAAARLGFLERGTGRVKVEAIDPEAWLAANRPGQAGGGEAATETSERAAESRPTEGRPTEPTEGRPAEGRPAERRPAEGRPIYLQVAALGSADNARELKTRLEGELSHPVRVASATGMHRVQVGPLAHTGQVEPARDELRRAGFAQTFIVKDAD
ncbi:septal ring lytic transglycosylase RlpA family protein [Halomonas sp. NO4]|uniref:septal ring lytic transglycosylase RlpA family protein n=1 Tax=Halomonas sp. NO4 TaxID=2484813 RepID=UPI0013D3B19D|nr:septal ring lytic transglycosylase RlpA family protein [Halomonas sp. NO4]